MVVAQKIAPYRLPTNMVVVQKIAPYRLEKVRKIVIFRLFPHPQSLLHLAISNNWKIFLNVLSYKKKGY